MVDEDTRAFNRIMEAFSLPKKTEEEKRIREAYCSGSNKDCNSCSVKSYGDCF